jgi:hypothetical protein
MYFISACTLESDQYLTGSGTWADMGDSVKALVFQKMLQMTDNKVKHFRGDLFHDAVNLEATLDLSDRHEQSYIFMFNSSGTWLFEAEKFFDPSKWYPTREDQHRLIVYRKGGPEFYSYHLKIEDITLEETA